MEAVQSWLLKRLLSYLDPPIYHGPYENIRNNEAKWWCIS